ncbi:MAG: AMP-binding protein [Bacteroidota bacterium]
MLQERFVAYLENGIKENWEITALSDYQSESFTYGEVAREIARIHFLYHNLGIKSGDKIALVGKNSARWCIVYLATVTYGAVIVPILPDFTPEDIHFIVNHSDSVLFFCSDAIFETLKFQEMDHIAGVISVNHYTILDEKNQQLSKNFNAYEDFIKNKFPQGYQAKDFNPPVTENDKLAVISYTSGTTGFSKGVMLSHNSLAANIRFAQNHMPLNPGDRIVSFLPLAHTYGCAFEFLFPFSIGCSITILTKTPSPKIITQAFKEIRPALILSVPLVIEKIYKKQIIPVIKKPHMKILLSIPGLKNIILSKIRKKLTGVFGGNFTEVIIGGAPFNPEAEQFFKKMKFRYTVGYGMTECGPLISYAAWDEIPRGSSGKPVDTLEVKIDSLNPAKEAGEIILRGENVMEGYYKNKEATDEIIDKDGWLHTGDLGLMDEQGFIYIKGRTKSLILGANGKNIYPEEIEAAYNNRWGVAETVLVHRKEKLVMLIYPEIEVLKAYGMEESEFPELFERYRKEINNTIPGYMKVSSVEIHEEEFVKTPKRSIKRYLYH